MGLLGSGYCRSAGAALDSDILWWRRKSGAAAARLAAAIESETVLRPPEKAIYRGTTAPGYPGVNNNGTIWIPAITAVATS